MPKLHLRAYGSNNTNRIECRVLHMNRAVFKQGAKRAIAPSDKDFELN